MVSAPHSVFIDGVVAYISDSAPLVKAEVGRWWGFGWLVQFLQVALQPFLIGLFAGLNVNRY